MRQPQWTIYEAAILLNGYLELNEKHLPKMRIVKRVSNELRQMAVNNGMVIDDVFRNENGISYQIQSMDSAYVGHKVYVLATKLFSEIVEIYRNNRQQYETILRDAKSMMVPSHSNKDSFLAWSASNVSAKSSKWIESNLLLVEKFGTKAGIITGSIFDVSDVGVLDSLFHGISRSRPFQIINKKIYKHIVQDLQLYRDYLNDQKNVANAVEPEPNVKSMESIENIEPFSDVIQVEFLHIGDLSYTKPTGYLYKGKHTVSTGWKQVYVGLMTELCAEYLGKFKAIVDTDSSSTGVPLVVSSRRAKTFHAPMNIGSGLFVETNRSSTMLVNNIRRFLDFCGVAYEDVIITYEKKDNSSLQNQVHQREATKSATATYTKELVDVAEAIISTYFVNGMRKNAIIARKKFKNAYLEITGNELPERINIDDLASTVGYEYSEKIYAISSNNKEYIKALVFAAFKNGNHVIFYEELYKKNADFMTKAGIFSSDLLKVILKNILPECSYKYSSFSERDTDSLDTDIMACYGCRLLLSYNEIKSMLPYADMGQIRLVCSRNNRFVWAKEETYALAEKLHLSEVDINESKRIISEDIDKHGFSVFQRIAITASAELNPSVPDKAIKEAIYSLHLSTIYERKHSIISLPGASFSPSAVMDEYCNGLDEVTLKDLYEYEDELTSKTSYSLSSAYSTMIRVDKERFVSKDSIFFDITSIDAALALFVRDEIIPLKSVNSFTSFPEVIGYIWNSFLLDSYCKHFSVRFKSMGGPAKSKPVGAIFPAYMQFNNYDDLLSRVAAKSNIALNADEVSRFFTENAYTLRKIDASSIIAKAQDIRIQEE